MRSLQGFAGRSRAGGDDFAAAYDHMRQVIAAIEPHDSAERFRGLGAHVVFGKAQFVAPRFLEVGDTSVTARRFIGRDRLRARYPVDSGPRFGPLFHQ